MHRLTAAQAVELYCDGEGEHGDVEGDWTLVGGSHDHPHRQSRWHQRYWLIAHNEQGEHYGIDFGLGLTEYQEHDFPWEDVPDDRNMALTRLYPHTITRTEYRTKPAEQVSA
jgi:hypothetical protein